MCFLLTLPHIFLPCTWLRSPRKKNKLFHVFSYLFQERALGRCQSSGQKLKFFTQSCKSISSPVPEVLPDGASLSLLSYSSASFFLVWFNDSTEGEKKNNLTWGNECKWTLMPYESPSTPPAAIVTSFSYLGWVSVHILAIVGKELRSSSSLCAMPV